MTASGVRRPDLEAISVLRNRDFAAQRRWRLFSAAGPSTLRTENVVIARYPNLQAAAARIRHVQPLAEQLFQPYSLSGAAGYADASSQFGEAGSCWL